MDWSEFLLDQWHVKLVSAVLILAAWIDGRELRVPNWITFPMILSGLVYSTCVGGLSGLNAGFLGMCTGLLTLLPLYAVGGMGAGDVKLMAGMGAWLGWQVTLVAFCVSVVVGAAMAVVLMFRKGVRHHYENLLLILSEWMVVRNPVELSRIAAERKPRMQLLPYGIPICIGSISYFVYSGMI